MEISKYVTASLNILSGIFVSEFTFVSVVSAISCYDVLNPLYVAKSWVTMMKSFLL